MRTTRFGGPYRVIEQSKASTEMVEPMAGFSMSQPPTDLAPNQTPYAYNYLMREGGLELRPTLRSYTSNAKPLDIITGGVTVVSSVGSNYPLTSGTTQFAYYSGGSWSKLSYVSAGGLSSPPSGTTTDYYDMVQTYDPKNDDMIAVAGCNSYQTLFCWRSGSTVFSSITGAPRAKYVTAFDNFVVSANIRDVGSAQSKYEQRVQWSDRGNPLLWTFGGSSLAGFEDLLDARGEITKVAVQDDRVVVFFANEIYVGVRTTGATSFLFASLDRTIGCPYPWTVTLTPLGLMFMGQDFMVYVLPKGGGAASPVGQPVRRYIANKINNPAKAWSLYDPDTRQFRLYYPILNGTGLPQEALFLNIGENSYAPQTWVHSTNSFSLTRGFVATNDVVSVASTWNQRTLSWSAYANAWQATAAQLGFGNRAIAVGGSTGSIYQESSGTLDDTTPITATWRSLALGQDSPRNVKCLTEVRLDYQSAITSNITITTSRDLGNTFDVAINLALPAAPVEQNVNAGVYCAAQYPCFQVQTSSNQVRINRFQTQYVIGGQ